MSLNGRIQVSANFAEGPAAADLSSGTVDRKLTALLNYLDGSGAGQASKIYGDSNSVVQSVNTDLDLSGTLAGAFGTVVFNALKGLFIKAGDANPGNLTLGNGAAPFVGWFGAGTHTLSIAPGGVVALAEGSAGGRVVTATTADILRIASAATAGTYTYDVIVWGI